MFSSKRLATLALVAIGAWSSVSACSLEGDSCLRMSDCADGFYCNEGTCLAVEGASSSSMSSTSDATSPASDASAD